MEKKVKCKNCGAEVTKGIKFCTECGKKMKKPPIWLFILGGIVLLIAILIVGCQIKKTNDKKTPYTWPTTGVGALLPKPDLEYGKIGSESETYFSADLYFATEEDFNKYVTACKESGFTQDYTAFEHYYNAKDGDNNSMSIDLDNEELSVTITKLSAFSSTNSSSGWSSQTTPSTNTSSQTTSSKDASSGESSKSDVSFREWVDEYESYMDEYVEFMKNYNPSDTSSILKYTKILSKYTELVDKTSKLNKDDYSIDDWQYYLDAQIRVNEKLATLTQ